MSNETSKISELDSATRIKENALIPVVNTNTETNNIDLSTLRSALWFENAYADVASGLAGTEKGESFFVYEDENKAAVLGWMNQGGDSYSPLLDSSGQQIFLPANNLMKSLVSIVIGIPSFDELRKLKPLFEGQRVELLGWNKGSTLGGGKFIGHIGTATDDGGVIAAGTGFYWERIIDKAYLTPYQFGFMGNNTAEDCSSFIQYCFDNSYNVFIPKGTWYLKNTVYLRNGCCIYGDSLQSIVRKTPNITSNIFDTEFFSEENLSYKIVDVTIRDLTIYGTLETLGISEVNSLTADKGIGLRFYGGRITVENVTVTQSAGIGMIIKRPSDNSASSGYFRSVTSHKSGQEGMIIDTVDMIMSNVVVGWPWNSYQDSTSEAKSKVSKYADWVPTNIGGSGVIFSGSVELSSQFHVHNNRYGYGIIMMRNTNLSSPFTLRMRAEHLIAESCAAFVYMYGADSYHISILEVHSPKYGDGSYGSLVVCRGFSHTQIDSFDCLLDQISSSMTDITVLELTSQSANVNIKGNIRCFSRGETNILGVKANGTGHNLDLQLQGLSRGAYYSCTNTESNLQCLNMANEGIYLSGGTFTNKMSLRISDCGIGIGTGSNPVEFGIIKAILVNCTTPIGKVSGFGPVTWADSDIKSYANLTSTTYTGSKGIFESAAIDSSLQDNTVRTIDIPLNLIKVPVRSSLNLVTYYNSGTRGQILFARIISITIDKATVEYQVATQGTANIIFSLRIL